MRELRFERVTIVGIIMFLGLLAATPFNGYAQELDSDQKPIMASYQGKRINLANGWQGAQICVEQAANDVRCYASAKEYTKDLGRRTKAIKSLAWSDCPSGYACLWEHINYEGRRLQWRDPGIKNLADWGFRDQASSVNNRRQGGLELVDFRGLQIDPILFVRAGQYVSDLTRVAYPYGGTWNDKVDRIKLN